MRCIICVSVEECFVKRKGRVMKTLARTAFGFGVMLIGMQTGFASVLDSLSPAQRQDVLNGKTISVRETVTGSYWPRFKIFKKISAKAEESAAVFVDFENHKNYFGKQGIMKPDIVESYIVEGKCQQQLVDPEAKGTICSKTPKIGYFVKLPLGYKDRYTCQEKIESDPIGGYKVAWDIISSDLSYPKNKDIPLPAGRVGSDGSALFEDFQGETILVYSNLISPVWKFTVDWSTTINNAEAGVVGTVDRLAAQVVSEKSRAPKMLDEQLSVLKALFK